MIYKLTLALALAAVTSATLFREDPEHQKFLWESFKRDFGKRYETMDEEMHRFQVFVQNLRDADSRNSEELAAGGNAVHGITKFSDLSQAEFEARYLTANPKDKTENRTYDTTVRTVNKAAGLVDWTGTYTTPVKDQGYCGSCWAFSATEQIESDSMRTLKTSYVLSPAQITQCDTTSYGCDGGWTENAYDYVKKAGGIEQEKDYPYSTTIYKGTTGKCALPAKPTFAISVDGFTTIGTKKDSAAKVEESMTSYVQSTGPLSVCLDASKFNSYNGGILKSCGNRVNHCVQAVGVDASTSGYWVVRNSWGASWGESGFIRLAYGQNTCAITNDPTWVTVHKA